jgi:hypothetical protein
VKKLLRLTQVGLVVAFAAVSIWAQTADDLKTKYGEPFKAYEIRPGIMMTVKFDESGRASEMRIERQAATEKTIYLDNDIDQALAKEIVDELVPVSARGAKGDSFGLMTINGLGGTELENYENVDISYYFKVSTNKKESGKILSGIVAIVIKWKNRSHNQSSLKQ